MGNLEKQLNILGLSILLIFSVYVIGGVLLRLVVDGLQTTGLNVMNSPALLLGVKTVVLQGITFSGITLFYIKFSEKDWNFIRVQYPTLRDVGVASIGFFLLISAMYTIRAFTSFFDIQIAQNSAIELGKEDPTGFLVLIPLSFLLIGPGEELLNRGLIQGLLSEEFHPVRAILLTSALFAVTHISSLNGRGKIVYLITVFVLSLILGATYEYTDNLIVPALIHGSYDALIFVSWYLR